MITESSPRRLDFLDHAFLRFTASLSDPAGRPSRAIAWAIAVVAVFVIFLAASPTLVISDYIYDVFIPLDGAWRMLNGQWPHLDFYTPVGDLYYVMLSISARLFGLQPKLVLWENLLLVPFVVLAAIQGTRDRLPNSLRAVLIVMAGLFCISPRALDDPVLISFLASYNRHSWTLMIPLMTAALLPRQTVPSRAWIGDAVMMGLVVLALAYLKITFACAATGLLLLAAITVPSNRWACLAAVIGAAIALGLVTTAGPLNLAYVSDLERAGQVAKLAGEGVDPYRFFKMRSDILSEWFDLLMPLVFAFWMGRSARNDLEHKQGNQVLLVTMIACATSIGLAWQNHDHTMPTQIVAMAVAFAGIWRRSQARRSTGYDENTPSASAGPIVLPAAQAPLALAGLSLIFLMGVTIIADARIIISHLAQSVLDTGQPAATLSPTLRDLRLPRDSRSPLVNEVLAGKMLPELYSTKSTIGWYNDVPIVLDDAWRLFQAHRPTEPRVATLFFAQILPYLTLTPPPRHLPAWIDTDRTVGLGAPLIPETSLDDTNVVMIPKVYDHDLLLGMIDHYLKANFVLAGETPLWQMWVRTTPLPAPTGN